jgi:hypothetical protein
MLRPSCHTGAHGRGSARAIGSGTGRLGRHPCVEAAAPGCWPRHSILRGGPVGAARGLAHLEEMVPWLGEMERIPAGGLRPSRSDGSRPTPRGDPERDRSLRRASCTTARSLIDRLDRRWRTLTPEDLGRRGLHPRLGEMTIAEIADRLLLLRTTLSSSTRFRETQPRIVTRRCSFSTRSMGRGRLSDGCPAFASARCTLGAARPPRVGDPGLIAAIRSAVCR